MIRILFMSIEGNTRHFVHQLIKYAKQQHRQNSERPLINSKEITDQSDFALETRPYFVFVPTYLIGGSQNVNAAKEIMTTTLNEYVSYGQNARRCRGIVGSGNRNFNVAYCLTAKRYARKFHAPDLDSFEIRGTRDDLKHIYAKLSQVTKKAAN